MGLVGITIGILYIAAGYAVYWALIVIWEATRPEPTSTLLGILATALIVAYLTYVFGTTKVLASLEAFELPPEHTPRLYTHLGALSDTMDISQPRLFVGRLGGPNALSLGGPNSGIVVFDHSLFQLLTFDEFIGVLAHELAHLENHDSLIQTIAQSFLQLIITIIYIILLPLSLLLLGIAIAVAGSKGEPPAWPETLVGKTRTAISQSIMLLFVAITLLLFAHSRRREFIADDRAASVTGQPLSLARALWKIERTTSTDWDPLSSLTIHGDEHGILLRLLSTHPTMDDRINRLRTQASHRKSNLTE